MEEDKNVNGLRGYWQIRLSGMNSLLLGALANGINDKCEMRVYWNALCENEKDSILFAFKFLVLLFNHEIVERYALNFKI